MALIHNVTTGASDVCGATGTNGPSLNGARGGTIGRQWEEAGVNQVRFFFGASLSAMVLVGCGGRGGFSPATPETATAKVNERAFSEQGFAPGRSVNELLVADYTSSTVLIYPAHAQHRAPVGTISDGVQFPYNIAVDRYGTLYVQNGNDTITEYRKGRKTVSKTLVEPSGTSTCTRVIVGGDGTVYSANSKEVFEFANGSNTPTTTLSVPYATGLALDSKNNLFVGWDRGPMYGGGVYKFTPGNDVRKTRLSTVEPKSLAVDSHDDLLVGSFGGIAIFKPGGDKSFRYIDTGQNDVYQFAFDNAEKYVYIVSDADLSRVFVYDYATGKLASTVKKGLFAFVSGVAVRPAAPQ